jgi:hypothetical protein
LTYTHAAKRRTRVSRSELSDGLVGRLGRGHLDEGEAARPTGVPIGNDLNALDAVDLVEELAQLFSGRAERKTADKKLLTHVCLVIPRL